MTKIYIQCFAIKIVMFGQEKLEKTKQTFFKLLQRDHKAHKVARSYNGKVLQTLLAVVKIEANYKTLFYLLLRIDSKQTQNAHCP